MGPGCVSQRPIMKYVFGLKGGSKVKFLLDHLGYRFDAAQRSRSTTREKTDLPNKTSSSVDSQNALLVSRSINELKTPIENDEKFD